MMTDDVKQHIEQVFSLCSYQKELQSYELYSIIPKRDVILGGDGINPSKRKWTHTIS